MTDTTPEFDIAILLPTRGRSDSLERSVKSVIELAADPSRIQIMFGFDNDDDVGTQCFVDELQPAGRTQGKLHSNDVQSPGIHSSQ